eukprot:g6239.t1
MAGLRHLRLVSAVVLLAAAVFFHASLSSTHKRLELDTRWQPQRETVQAAVEAAVQAGDAAARQYAFAHDAQHQIQSAAEAKLRATEARDRRIAAQQQITKANLLAVEKKRRAAAQRREQRALEAKHRAEEQEEERRTAARLREKNEKQAAKRRADAKRRRAARREKQAADAKREQQAFMRRAEEEKHARDTKAKSTAAQESASGGGGDDRGSAGTGYPRSLYKQFTKLRTLDDLLPAKQNGDGKCTSAFLQVYTGPLLETYSLLVDTARRNPDYQWITVHLGELAPEPNLAWDINWAPNYQLVQATPKEVSDWIFRTLKVRVEVGLDDPTKWHRKQSGTGKINGYKWNEYKPFYAKMFEKWIDGCEFWAYGDMDVAYGDINALLPPAYRAKYDVISDEGAHRLTGPFTMFRNTAAVNNIPLSKGCESEAGYGGLEWRKLLQETKYYNFDEQGFANCVRVVEGLRHNWQGARRPQGGWQCNPVGTNRCVWLSDGTAWNYQGDGDTLADVHSPRHDLLYIHIHAGKKAAAASLRGITEAKLSQLARDGWLIRYYLDCEKKPGVCGVFPVTASNAPRADASTGTGAPAVAATATVIATTTARPAVPADDAHQFPRSHYAQFPKLLSLADLKPVKGIAVFLQIYTGPLLLTWPLIMESARRNPDCQWITVHLGELAPEPNLAWDINWAPNYQLVQATPK